MTEFDALFVPPEPNPVVKALIVRAMLLRAKPDEFISLFHPDAVLHMIGDRRHCLFLWRLSGAWADSQTVAGRRR